MTNRTFLFLGGFLAVSCLFVAAPGCGDDDEDDTAATGTTQTTTGTPGGTGGSGNSGAEGGNGGTGNTGGMPGGGGPGGAGGGTAQTCDAYCTAVEANCTAANDQWGMTVADQCKNTCAEWEAGMASDTAGNTLGCHIYHAGAAAMDAATHCIHAGPAGDGACGAPCDNFCELAEKICPDVYLTEVDCQAECALFPAMPKYTAAETGGDSFACRLYHLTAAATDTVHCDHINEASGPCQ